MISYRILNFYPAEACWNISWTRCERLILEVRGTAISLQALAAFKSNAAERPSGTPRGYVEHFRQKRWPDGELVRAFLQAMLRMVTVTRSHLPRCKKPVLDRFLREDWSKWRKKLCKESQFQSCCVLPTWNTSISFQKKSTSFCGGIIMCPRMSIGMPKYGQLMSIAHAFVRYANQNDNLNHPCKLA